MSEDFAWVNTDKHERIEAGILTFSYGFPYACWVGNPDIDAVCTLLQSRWKGDTVIYAGDSTTDSWPDQSPEAMAYRANPKGSPVFLDYAECAYEDITGFFPQASLNPRIDFGVDPPQEIPYTGPFNVKIECFRYVINHTKRLYYDRKATPVVKVTPHKPLEDTEILRFDPFPALFSKGNRLGLFYSRDEELLLQSWIGDDVEPSHEVPPAGYRDISHCDNHKPWSSNIIADDETILAVMGTERYRKLVDSSLGATAALEVILRDVWG